MNRHHLFYSPVIETELDLDFNDLTNKIVSGSETESGRLYSNRGGWQSDDNFMFRDGLRPYLDKIDRHVNDTCHECYDYSFKYNNSWVNVNTKGNYNVAHQHAGATLSAVLWIQAPEDCGDIVFYHPAGYSLVPEIYDDLEPNWRYTPKQGSMLIFPSYLYHFVAESETNDKRISIALNYS